MTLDARSQNNLALEVKNLSRAFRRRSRAPGLKAALKAFYRADYSETFAVKSVSFTVQTGACAGLVGANGAGKTTLLKMASGLLHPTAGEIRVLGHQPAQRERRFLKKIGLVMGQKSQLWSDIPAGDTFELLAAIYQVPRAEFESRLHELSQLFKVDALLGVQVRKLSL